MERDQIAEYLDQLRSRLLTSRRRVQLILDEAEDHLREAAAAGMAAGLTEAEAQRTAIASFGSVRAVVRAHAATRPWRAAAHLADVVLAARKQASVYLLAVFAAGLLGQWLLRLFNWLDGVRPMAAGVPVCTRCSVSRDWIAQATGGLGPESFPWLAAGAAGAVLIGGFALIRRWQQRGGRVRPLLPGRYSPMAGAIVFSALTAFMAWGWTRLDLPFWASQDKKLALFAALGSAAFYLLALGAALLRGLRAQLASA